MMPKTTCDAVEELGLSIRHLFWTFMRESRLDELCRCLLEIIRG